MRVAAIDSGGMTTYLKHYFSFVCRSLWNGLRLRFTRWRPDVIWASSPPLFVGVSGWALSKIFGCPLVFDIRDIWPQSAVAAQQISKGGRAFRLGRILERWLYNSADHITCVSQPMANYISTQTSVQTAVIYNGIYENTTQPTSNCGTIHQRILYAGNFGRVQRLDTLIRGFALALSDNVLLGWHLVFIGGGALEHDLRSLILELGLQEHIELRPPVEKQEALCQLATSAALVININDDEVFDLTIPSKVFDYMSVGRPILYGIRGEGAEILCSTGANIRFDSENPESFAWALKALEQNSVSLEKHAEKNPNTVRGVFSREANTQKLIKVFERVSRIKK